MVHWWRILLGLGHVRVHCVAIVKTTTTALRIVKNKKFIWYHSHKSFFFFFFITQACQDLFRSIASPVVLQSLHFSLSNLITQLLNQIVKSDHRTDGDVLSQIPLSNPNSTLGL